MIIMLDYLDLNHFSSLILRIMSNILETLSFILLKMILNI